MENEIGIKERENEMSKTKALSKTVTTVIILLLTFSMFSVAVNILSVKASPDTIVLSPNSGPPGTSVNVTAGEGNFTSGEDVYTYFETIAAPVNSTKAASDGSLNATFTFQM
jgi:hypothetical protein